MGPKQLAVVGWLSITNAVLTVPLFGFSIFLQALGSPAARVTSALLTMASTVLFIYVFYSLRDLLHTRFDFHDTDALMTVLILGSVVVAGAELLGVALPSLEAAAGWLSLLSVVPFGVIFIVFAVKLLNLHDGLFGMLKPLSYLTIATGLCFGTVILIPLGLLTSAASDIVLGIILFRAGARMSAHAP